MSYFQTDDIPTSPDSKPKPHLKLISPIGTVIFIGVKSYILRNYLKENYPKEGCNYKRIWRSELTNLGYKVVNVY